MLGSQFCVLPGTELAFANLVEYVPAGLFGWRRTRRIDHRAAIFRQIDKERAAAHHGALEFPDGPLVLLTALLRLNLTPPKICFVPAL
jgi:hypothetical protein